jgi:exopolysaccharide production protein ExoQ
MKHPLLGYGFMDFGQGVRGESANIALIMNWPGESYAENGVIELCLELGIIGVALYLLVFLRAVKDAIYCFKMKPSSTVMWYISLLFLLAISNIAGGVLLSPVDLKFLLPMVAFMGLRREAKRMRSLRIA